MRTPEEAVRAVAAGVCRIMRGGLTAAEEAAQFDELAACYAEHTDVQHPLNPYGDTPLRNRAVLRDHFSAGPGPSGVLRYDVVDDHVYMTADPEVVIFEFRYASVVDGRIFTVPCIFVVRVRDGEIVESRDYSDHAALARAFGRRDEAALDPRATADRVEIEALRGEFTDAVMMHDFERLASLFTEDGVVRIPHIDAEAAGRAEIRAGVERLQGMWEFFVQITHPGVVRVEGDTASGRASISELGRSRDGGSHRNRAVYHDRYRRGPDGWKFTERVYEIRYLDTTP